LFVWLESSVLPDSAVIAFARDDDYFFGVLRSRAHELWALKMGTFLGVGNDPRYTPTTCFETFPFPEPSEERRAEISDAARRLDELRRNWLNPEGASAAELKKRTLTNLYNARPTWLQSAHDRLDRAVYAAYGWAARRFGRGDPRKPARAELEAVWVAKAALLRAPEKERAGTIAPTLNWKEPRVLVRRRYGSLR
jgi:hypothetical protein